jgi:hypothetical protein
MSARAVVVANVRGAGIVIRLALDSCRRIRTEHADTDTADVDANIDRTHGVVGLARQVDGAVAGRHLLRELDRIGRRRDLRFLLIRAPSKHDERTEYESK